MLRYKEISRIERTAREIEWERPQEFWIHFNVFCVVIAKYKEISWRVRIMLGGKK